MKSVLALALAFVPWLSFGAAPPPAEKQSPYIGRFYVANVTCSRCVDSINESVVSLPGVQQLRMGYDTGFALICFDPAIVSHHQVAQAIADALPMKGARYEPSLQFFIPDYATGSNAQQVDAVFKRFEVWATLSPLDFKAGRFQLQFLPLKPAPGAKGPLGLRLDELQRAIEAPPPAGLGLKFELADGVRKQP